MSGDIVFQSGPTRFLSIRAELFTIESKDRTLSSSGGHTNEQLKLRKGTYRWPFTVKLPKGVGIPFGGPDGAVSKYILPASLTDARSKTAIKYELLVRIKKGTLSAGHKCESKLFTSWPATNDEHPILGL